MGVAQANERTECVRHWKVPRSSDAPGTGVDVGGDDFDGFVGSLCERFYADEAVPACPGPLLPVAADRLFRTFGRRSARSRGPYAQPDC